MSSELTLNEYQKQAFSIAMYPEHGTGSVLALSYTGLGLGEVGEIQGKLKKIIRDSGGKVSPDKKEAIVAEIGDALWYLSALSTELGVNLEDVGRKNLDKLFGRKERGTLQGSGDNR